MNRFAENVKIQGRVGTWYEIDSRRASDGREYILFESEQYGDEAACVLCIKPSEDDLSVRVSSRTGEEIVTIPERFEVEETYDDIDTALEQDIGLDVYGG